MRPPQTIVGGHRGGMQHEEFSLHAPQRLYPPRSPTCTHHQRLCQPRTTANSCLAKAKEGLGQGLLDCFPQEEYQHERFQVHELCRHFYVSITHPPSSNSGMILCLLCFLLVYIRVPCIQIGCLCEHPAPSSASAGQEAMGGYWALPSIVPVVLQFIVMTTEHRKVVVKWVNPCSFEVDDLRLPQTNGIASCSNH